MLVKHKIHKNMPKNQLKPPNPNTPQKKFCIHPCDQMNLKNSSTYNTEGYV